MIDYAVGSILTLVSVIVGYLIGKNINPFPKDTIEKVKTIFEKIPVKSDLGAIPRPTQAEIERFNNPLKEAEDKAMGETFAEIIKR
jgi:hypothetical protein